MKGLTVPDEIRAQVGRMMEREHDFKDIAEKIDLTKRNALTFAGIGFALENVVAGLRDRARRIHEECEELIRKHATEAKAINRRVKSATKEKS